MSVPTSATVWLVVGLIAAAGAGVFAADRATTRLPRRIQGLPPPSIPDPISWSPPGRACWALKETRLYAAPGKGAFGGLSAGRPLRCGSPAKWTPVALPGESTAGFIDGWSVGFESPVANTTIEEAKALLASDPNAGIGALFALAAAGQEDSPAWGDLADALLNRWLSPDDAESRSTYSVVTDCQPLAATGMYTLYVVGAFPLGVEHHPELFAVKGDRWVAVHLAAGQLVTGRVEPGCTAALHVQVQASLIQSLQVYTDLATAPIGLAALASRAADDRIVRME